MTQRRILIITNRVPFPLKDGGNIAMDAMIEGYHNAGWQVFLLSMNTSKHYIGEEQRKSIFRHLYAFETVDINNEIKAIDILKNLLFSREPEHTKRFQSNEFSDKLQRSLTSFKPDVVQVESVYLTTYLPTIKKHSDTVTVLRMHNVEYQIWQGLSKKAGNFVKKIYFRELAKRVRNYERSSWKEYELLLAITEKDAALVNRLEDVHNITVAPFSIDESKIKPNSNTERWVGYHIGAMDWIANRSGMRWFLSKAWPLIHKALPKFEFYFAGRNMPNEFKEVDAKGVFCLDEVPSAEEFIADKKILIVPLWSGGGIRVKILEAMAAGKIVITTTNGIKGIEAMPDVHYLRVHKPEDFVKAIRWCLDNRPLAEKMAENARDLVREKYIHSKVLSNVIGEVEILLKNRRH